MALLQSIQNEHESEANDGQQQNWVEASVNDCEKTIIPNDLLPVVTNVHCKERPGQCTTQVTMAFIESTEI